MGKTYYAYIQSDCGTETSSWEGTSFTTLCGPISNLPYMENFTDWGTGTGKMPGCWGTVPATYPYISSTYNNTNGEGGGSLYFYPSSTNLRTFGILPEFDVPGKSLQDIQISFSYRGVSIGSAIIVGVMESQTDTASFVAVDTLYVTTTTAWTEGYDVAFNNYMGTGKYIAFLSKLGFSSTSANTMYIDNVTLELLPTCRTPVNVVLNNVLDSKIEIAWTPRGTESSWELVIGETGFNPDTATAITVTQPYYTFMGLSSMTNYQIYVRANCGTVDGMSLWSRVVNACTTDIPEELPLNTGFEDAIDNAKWTLLNGTQTNKWLFGTAVNNGGSKALYISNGTGETAANDYTHSTSYVMAYRKLRFEPGIY